MRATAWANRFEAPEGIDPADFAKQMQRLATEIDETFGELTNWAAHLTDQGPTELGTPAVMLSTTVNISGFPANAEKAVEWNNVMLDNTGTNSGTTEMYLPDQDQRYWWWMGTNIIMAPISASGRYTTRIWVQDSDPATGQILTGAYRYNQYMKSTGNQSIITDGFFRTGGGRIRVTMSHGNTGGAVNLLASSSVWAIRICPDR